MVRTSAIGRDTDEWVDPAEPSWRKARAGSGLSQNGPRGGVPQCFGPAIETRMGRTLA